MVLESINHEDAEIKLVSEPLFGQHTGGLRRDSERIYWKFLRKLEAQSYRASLTWVCSGTQIVAFAARSGRKRFSEVVALWSGFRHSSAFRLRYCSD